METPRAGSGKVSLCKSGIFGFGIAAGSERWLDGLWELLVLTGRADVSSSKQQVGYPSMLGTSYMYSYGYLGGRIRHVDAMNTLDAYVSAMRCYAMPCHVMQSHYACLFPWVLFRSSHPLVSSCSLLTAVRR